MNTFDKILGVFGKNLGYTIILILAIIFFAFFSDGLIYGLITAFSAVVAYTCIVMLYKEFKKEFSSKKNVATSEKKAPGQSIFLQAIRRCRSGRNAINLP